MSLDSAFWWLGMSLRTLSCPSDFRISPLTTKTPVSSVQSNFPRPTKACICIHLKFSFTVPHTPMFAITFTKRGIIIHKVIYKCRDNLNIPLIFLSKKGSCYYKNCILSFILIFSPWWNILWVAQDPICHWFTYRETQFFVLFCFSPGLAQLQRGKIVSSLSTMSSGYLQYQPVFCSLLALNLLPLLMI